MPLVDPYSPCLCGSGKKYKWCCQKVESYVERAFRLEDNGQFDAAEAALDEGLAKVPGSPMLSLRKAALLIGQRHFDQARECVEKFLGQQPDHVEAAVLGTRLVLIMEGPVAAASRFQRVLAHATPESRPKLARLALILGKELVFDQHFPAAMKHLELASSLDESLRSAVDSAYRSARSSSLAEIWSKQPYELCAASEALSGPRRDEFESALGWARDGLWESAASAFELLTADPLAGLAAERNLGFCRLWLGDDQAAEASLLRWLEKAPATTGAADIAALCLAIDEERDPEPIERVRLTWPLRDRDGLLGTLTGHDRIVEDGVRPLNVDDDESPEVLLFHWLDRPKVQARTGLTIGDIPRVQADLLLGVDTVMLEVYDDGRLNDLIDQFPMLAGRAVPPAHPRTKIIGTVNRDDHAMSWHWYLPPELPEDEKRRLNHEMIAHLTEDVWPETPQTFLGHRTPLQVAQSGKDPILLRGAVLALENSEDDRTDLVNWAALRKRLGIPPEPAIDPDTVEIERLPVCRLFLVPLAQLNDDRLVALHDRAREYGLTGIMVAAAREIDGRQELVASGKVQADEIYSGLCASEMLLRNREAALEWLKRGRAVEPAEQRRDSACVWDLLELRVRIQFDKPEDWVPELAALLDRYENNEHARSVLFRQLIDMGLVLPVESPDRPGEIMLDSRPLQQLLARYGPKVTTASGYLGVSATRGEIWTPASETKGSSIWTPGSEAGSSGEGQKPRIIVPG